VRPATLPTARPSPGLAGGRLFAAPNPPAGATIWYHLKESAGAQVGLQITDVTGKVIADLSPPGDAGLHRVNWNLRPPSKRNGPMAKPVAPGDYAVRLTAAGQTVVKPLKVDAAIPGAAATSDDEPEVP
jgi:hypothetical protein